jgi:hypothetical protein
MHPADVVQAGTFEANSRRASGDFWIFLGAWRSFAATRGLLIEKKDRYRGSVVGQQTASHADGSVRVVSAKIKSRTQIRRADTIDLKKAIGFRRKSLLLNILILRKIYRYS